jgi:hypothetical protein
MSTKRALAVAALVAAPATASAAQSVIQLSQTIQTTVYRPLIALIIGFALLLFLWGIYRYIAQSGDESNAREGVKMMSYGIIILFVMVSVWGIVHLALSFFGFESGQGGAPGSSVFGVEARDYDSGLNYAPAEQEKVEFNRNGFQP